jgi:hypothetical protein
LRIREKEEKKFKENIITELNYCIAKESRIFVKKLGFLKAQKELKRQREEY